MFQDKNNDYLKVLELIKSGTNTPEACKAVGISKSTFYKWKELSRKKPGPKKGYKHKNKVQVVSLALPTNNSATVKAARSNTVLVIRCDVGNLSSVISSMGVEL